MEQLKWAHLFMMVFLISPSSGIKTIQFPSDPTQSRPGTIARVKNPYIGPIKDISLCLWAKFYFQKTEYILGFYDSKGKAKLKIHSSTLFGFLIIKETSYMYEYPGLGKRQPDEWYHFCITFSGDINTVKMYINGQTVIHERDDKYMASLFPEDMISNFIFGAHDIIGAAMFHGKLTSINCWSKVLSNEEIRKDYNCGMMSTTLRICLGNIE